MSNVVWRKSAAKDVRPFFGTVALENCLEGSEIRLFEDAPYVGDLAFLVEPHEIDKLAISIKHNLNPSSLAFESIKRADLILAITASQPFLKKTQVVATYSLASSLPQEISIGDEVLAALGGGANLNIEVALCLAKKLPKKPGSPFLSGHWLSKKRFSLRPPKLAEDFDVSPRDDVDWVKIGFPAKTPYLVEFFGGMNESGSKDRQIAKVWIHSDIYRKLTVESNQRLAKPVMANIAAEITCQILTLSFSEWELADSAVPQSPLAAFLKKFNRIQKCSLEDLKIMVKQTGMPKLRALVHADIQTVRSIAEG